MVGLGVGWLIGADRPEHYAFVLAAVLGWAAPVAAARFTAGMLGREREVGALGLLDQAVGRGGVVALALLLGAGGPLLDVALGALLLAPFSESPEALAAGAAALGLQVLGAAVLGAALGLAGDGGRRAALRRAGSVPVFLYVLGLAGMIEEALRPQGAYAAFRALPPLVMPCLAGGWDGGAWSLAMAGVVLAASLLLLVRASRPRG